MVRGQEPVSRRTKPRQEACHAYIPCTSAGALPCLSSACCLAGLCAFACAWVGQVDGSRPDAFTRLLQVPRNSSPKIGFDRAICQGPGVERLAAWQTGRTNKQERGRTCEAEAEGGCQCGLCVQGPLCLLASDHPPKCLALFGCNWCGGSPKPLSEHGLTNTSSNELYHHRDLDHATCRFCL